MSAKVRKWHVMGSDDVFSVFAFAVKRAAKIETPVSRFHGQPERKKGVYQVGKLFATGGFCDIYEAQDAEVETGASLAIKVISDGSLNKLVKNEVAIHWGLGKNGSKTER